MKSRKNVIKFITSILLAVLVFFNMTINFNVKNAKASDEEQTNKTKDEKEISKVQSPAEKNIKGTDDKKYVNNDIVLFFKDDVKNDDIDKVIKSVNGTVIGQVSSLNEYQIKVKESTLEELNDMIFDIMKNYSDYVALASIDYISENTSIKSNDPWGNDAIWNESNVSGKNWGLEAIQAQSAWQYNNIFDNSVNKINIGVVDGGFDTTAEDFPDSYEKFSSTDCDLPFNHGTFVTSIIAAKANNNKGITGIVWNPGKLYLASTATYNNGLTLSSLLKGLSDVIENGANVINCSFGGGSPSEASSMVSAILMAKMLGKGHDFIIVESAGNGDEDGFGIDARNNNWFCGIDDEVLNNVNKIYGTNKDDIKNRIIVVGAAEKENDGSYMQTQFSNGGDAVSICAPGKDIYSQEAGSNYEIGDGTSYAVPHVVGATELTWRANPKLSGDEVRNIVCDKNNTIYTAKDNPESHDAVGDSRMVDAKLAVEAALKTRDDLVTIYYNSDEEVNLKYALDDGNFSNAKSLLMNDNLDNNGYNKSITVPLDNASCLYAKLEKNGACDDNNGEGYKLKAGAYAIDNGKVIEVRDKFSELRISDFKVDENNETSVGDVINLTTDVVNNEGDTNYSYSVIDSEGKETVIKDYSKENNASWCAKSKGKYTLVSKVKDSRGYVITKKRDFNVVDNAKITSYKISPDCYGAVGKSVSINASVTGGKGKSTCKFIAQGGNYEHGMQEKYFSKAGDGSGFWTPDTAGTYSILCDVTDSAGVIKRYKLCDYVVKDNPSYRYTIASFNVSKSSNIQVGEDILLNFNFFGVSDGEFSNANCVIEAVNEDGTKEFVWANDYDAKELHSVKFAPTKSGKWTLKLEVGHEDEMDTKEITINVNNYSENTATIYYKGFESPNIHYGVNNENWTNVPGIKMTKTSEMEGYTHKYTINLGSSNNAAVCFNDGNGNWDSNYGKNYIFNAGVYTYCNGNITKLSDRSNNFAVSYFKADQDEPRTAGTYINLRAETVNASGDVNYTFKAKDSDNNEVTIYEGTQNRVSWQPLKGGTYKLSVTATNNGNSSTKEFKYKVNDKIKVNSFNIDKKSPQLIGSTVNMSVNAVGGTGKYAYWFYITEGYTKKYIKANVPENTCTWVIPDNMKGSYKLGVDIYDETGGYTSYDIPYEIKDKNMEPLNISGISCNNSDILITNNTSNFTVNLQNKGQGKLTYSAYSVNEDGTKDIITNNSDSDTFDWTPSKSGKWMMFATVTDEAGQNSYYQISCKVINEEENIATIYYNSSSEKEYIQYKTKDGTWNSDNGIEMQKTNEKEGYTNKITILLGKERRLYCRFNNGQGLLDDNNSKNYIISAGKFGIKNNEVYLINDSSEFDITKLGVSNSDPKVGDSVDFMVETTGAKGNSINTIYLKNEDTNEMDVIAKDDTNSQYTWIPKSKGKWQFYIFVQDDKTLETFPITGTLIVS